MGKNDEDKQYSELIKFTPSNQSSYSNIYQKIGKELNKSAFPLVYYIFRIFRNFNFPNSTKSKKIFL